jgi:putative ABC transport system permease protein
VLALADTARVPKRRRTLIAASRKLPVPLLIGVRLAASRPRRLVLSALSMALTVAMLVSVVSVPDRQHTTRVPGGLINPIHAEVDEVLYVITVVLVLLAAVNAIFVATATVVDSRRALAVSRSLGATSGQAVAGVLAAQLLAAIPGSLIGIPAGIGLVIATSPARISARRPPAEVLGLEAA